MNTADIQAWIQDPVQRASLDAIEFDGSNTDVYRPIWKPFQDNSNSVQTYREKKLPSQISNNMFIRWYYAGLSILGIYIIFSILGKSTRKRGG